LTSLTKCDKLCVAGVEASKKEEEICIMLALFETLAALGRALQLVGAGLRDLFTGLPLLMDWFSNLFSSGVVPY